MPEAFSGNTYFMSNLYSGKCHFTVDFIRDQPEAHPLGSETEIFYFTKKNTFRNGSRPRAGWPARLVLIRVTPRAEGDVIGIQRC